MTTDPLDAGADTLVEEILGYLNFSSGATDPRFLAGVNALFARLAADEPAEPTWRVLGRRLRDAVERLRGTSKAFQRLDQAEAVLALVFDDVLPEYRRHHADLLFHQTDELLFSPLFVGLACEAVLVQEKPWEPAGRIAKTAVTRLNDFLGHRPIAVLEGRKKLEPYDHERVRPIPLWIRGVGAGAGRYRELIDATLDVLRGTDPDLLAQAWFDLERLDELAMDPRAYDFEHPVNRRPNYQFGQWDPDTIDNHGYYRRFVVQQVTLDAIVSRVEQPGDLPRDELLEEAAAVLAGTMLMGSGVSGDGPGCHDSTMTLGLLLPHVAEYRDAFYELFVKQLRGRHVKRLRAEAKQLRQPLGGARQHLNQYLARLRASQLQHVHLAKLFARMGYAEAARREARVVPVASARMQSEIECRLTTAHQQIDHGRLDEVAESIAAIESLLHRAIGCGALVDPRNILGFDAQFSLFPAMENSCHDHRVDELIELMEEIFGLYARAEKTAAAAGRTELREQLSGALKSLTGWWDQFASTEVSSVEGISGRKAWESADHVATTLGAWAAAGTAAGDIAFWRKHVAKFRTTEAYALVVEALLDQNDLVGSMALLMQWLSESDEIPLVEGSYSFHELALDWMHDLWWPPESAESASGAAAVEPDQRWAMTRKFMDYLEAGGEGHCQVPELELSGASPADDQPIDDEPQDDSDGLFDAAYENVTYRDTTDDGFEGEIFEHRDGVTDFELTGEAERISRRLAFLRMLARLWNVAAGQPLGREAEPRDDALRAWLAQAEANRRGLLHLLDVVHRYPIPAPSATEVSLSEYDRRQGVKDVLLERIVIVAVETSDAARRIRSGLADQALPDGARPWEAPVDQVLRALRAGDAAAVRRAWPTLATALADEPLLYLPTVRGGAPRRIVASRVLQHALDELLAGLPRLGLLALTCELIATIQQMERNHPVGQGAITEFDRMFDTGYRAIVQCLVDSAEGQSDEDLIHCLEEISEPLVRLWVGHSRNIRFSPLEVVADTRRWGELKRFIQDYGHDLFTQTFMAFGNLRAILHQGVGSYFDWLAENPDAEDQFRILADLDGPLPREKAVAMVSIAIEAVLDNYNEYMDYNSSTTQSDRGEMLYTLLDFLRLTASYDRVAWHLDPLVAAHEVLIRSGRSPAADLWRDTFAQQTAEMADEHLDRLAKLERLYGMKLRSVADRLGQRFVRPMEIDRLRALVGPAMDEPGSPTASAAFARLQQATDELTAEPSGVGFLVPGWLEALEDEVDNFRSDDVENTELNPPDPTSPKARLSLNQARRQIRDWGKTMFGDG